MLIGVIFVDCGFVGLVLEYILRKAVFDKRGDKDMILNDKEKKRLVDTLTWMITDMKYKSDATKLNREEGSEGGYSPELKEAMDLLEDIKKTETTETTGCHRKSVAVNCREFDCTLNRQGTCALSAVTLERIDSLHIGHLKCVQAEEPEKEGEEK